MSPARILGGAAPAEGVVTTGGLLALAVGGAIWLGKLAQPKISSMLDSQDGLIARQRTEIAELREDLSAAHLGDVESAAKIAHLEARVAVLQPPA